MSEKLIFGFAIVFSFMVGMTLAIAIASLPSGCAAFNNYRTSKDIFTKVSNSSVVIRTELGSGSGTVVKEDINWSLILTCAHVVQDFEIVRVESLQGTFVGFVDKTDPELDLAVIAVHKALLPLKIAKEEPELFSKVYVVGNPISNHSVTEGFIASKNNNNIRYGYNNWNITGSFVLFGISGGTITNENSELICVPETVTVWHNIPFAQVGSCIPLPDIKNFLSQYGV